MSGLDLLIRRLMAQRASLERAAELVAGLPGPAVLIGYGDGAAYDHLSEILRKREIVVFDEALPPDTAIPAERYIAGDPAEALPSAWERFRRSVVLAHLNFPVTISDRMAAELAPLVAPLLHAGGIVISEPPLELPGWEALSPPEGLREGRHHLYRAR